MNMINDLCFIPLQTITQMVSSSSEVFEAHFVTRIIFNVSKASYKVKGNLGRDTF